jgi:glycosyltransferase involved in cell wall biosynthesis
MTTSTRNVAVTEARYLREQPVPPVPVTRSRRPTVSAIMPTLNEALNVAPIVAGLPACVIEIIVVDGRSDDGTPEVALAADPRVRIVMERRKGKGAALLAGFAAAQGDVIVALDADGSMDPAEVEIFQSMLARGYDLVKGSRQAVGGSSEDFTVVRRLGNAGLTRVANATHRTHWSDMCYGYFGFWRDVLPVINLEWQALSTRALAQELGEEGSRVQRGWGPEPKLAYGDGFEIETAIFLRAARARLRIAEVPSRELLRHSGESHLRTVRDGWRVLEAIARERQRTRAALPESGAALGAETA